MTKLDACQFFALVPEDRFFVELAVMIDVFEDNDSVV